MKIVIAIFLLFLFSACSENKPALTLNEKNYLKTQDSLVKYKSDILAFSGEDSTDIADYMKLDYQSYQAKYQLSEREMDITRRWLNVRCEEIKVFKAMQENISRSKLNQYHSANSKDSIKGNYSFDKNLKPVNSKEDEDAEVKVLMDAFEEK